MRILLLTAALLAPLALAACDNKDDTQTNAGTQTSAVKPPGATFR